MVIGEFGKCALAAVLALSGCSGAPTQPVSDGLVHIAGMVRDFRTSAAIAGAHVTIGAAAATTDAGGTYSLTIPVDAGLQLVSIDGELIANINPQDRTFRGDFYAHLNGCIAAYGTVIEYADAAARVRRVPDAWRGNRDDRSNRLVPHGLRVFR